MPQIWECLDAKIKWLQNKSHRFKTAHPLHACTTYYRGHLVDLTGSQHSSFKFLFAKVAPCQLLLRGHIDCYQLSEMSHFSQECFLFILLVDWIITKCRTNKKITHHFFFFFSNIGYEWLILNQGWEDRNVLIKVNEISETNLQTEKKWSTPIFWIN